MAAVIQMLRVLMIRRPMHAHVPVKLDSLTQVLQLMWYAH